MKRYFAFAFPTYYPSGGWGDFEGDFDSIRDAQSRLKEVKEERDTFQVIDTKNGKICFSSKKRNAF